MLQLVRDTTPDPTDATDATDQIAEAPPVLPFVDAAAMQQYQDLLEYTTLPPRGRRDSARALCAKWGWRSAATVRRRVAEALRDGPQACVRKRRSDAGKRKKVPRELETYLLGWCTDRENRHRNVQHCIESIRQGHPEWCHLSESTIYDVHRSVIDGISGKSTKQRRDMIRMAGPGAEAPFPNHTWCHDFMWHTGWVFDETDGAIFLPKFGWFMDEFSRKAVGWSHYREETVEAMHSALFHAMTTHGTPLFMYQDNGMVQKSRWIRAICTRFGINLRAAIPKSPWMKKVESAHAGIQTQFDRLFFGADSFIGPQRDVVKYQSESVELQGHHLDRLRDRGKLPTVRRLAEDFQNWLDGVRHQRHHRGVNGIPAHRWLQVHCDDEITADTQCDSRWIGRPRCDLGQPVPEEKVAIELMPEADRDGCRTVHGNRVSFRNTTFAAPELFSFDGAKVRVRFLFDDYRKILTINPQNDQIICWATAQHEVAMTEMGWKERAVLMAANKAQLKEAEAVMAAAQEIARSGSEDWSAIWATKAREAMPQIGAGESVSVAETAEEEFVEVGGLRIAM